MKKFNLVVVLVWFAVWFMALSPTTSHVSENRDLLSWSERFQDEVIYEVNEIFLHYVPTFVELSGLETGSIDAGNSDYTIFRLKDSSKLFLFFMAAINFAFYAGRGDLRRWSENNRQNLNVIRRKLHAYRFRNRNKKLDVKMKLESM